VLSAPAGSDPSCRGIRPVIVCVSGGSTHEMVPEFVALFAPSRSRPGAACLASPGPACARRSRSASTPVRDWPGAGTANGHVIPAHDHLIALPSRRSLDLPGSGDSRVHICAADRRLRVLARLGCRPGEHPGRLPGPAASAPHVAQPAGRYARIAVRSGGTGLSRCARGPRGTRRRWVSPSAGRTSTSRARLAGDGSPERTAGPICDIRSDRGIGCRTPTSAERCGRSRSAAADMLRGGSTQPSLCPRGDRAGGLARGGTRGERLAADVAQRSRSPNL